MRSGAFCRLLSEPICFTLLMKLQLKKTKVPAQAASKS
jgi:hypothetical protein